MTARVRVCFDSNQNACTEWEQHHEPALRVLIRTGPLQSETYCHTQSMAG